MNTASQETRSAATLAEDREQAALKRLGTAVRARLAEYPTIYAIPVDRAEIFAIGDFLSSGECARLMAMIDAVAQPSRVFAVPGYPADYRTSYSGDLDPRHPLARTIERRIADLLGIDLVCGETVQGQRYTQGQEYRAHCDWFDPEAEYWPREQAAGGQRSWTAMAYLNDVTAGGATDFPLLGIDIEPKAGALLLWNNALPDGRMNPDVLHAALPVIDGTKYVITKWFRTRRWQPSRS